jgi:hypothetical protein
MHSTTYLPSFHHIADFAATAVQGTAFTPSRSARTVTAGMLARPEVSVSVHVQLFVSAAASKRAKYRTVRMPPPPSPLDECCTCTEQCQAVTRTCLHRYLVTTYPPIIIRTALPNDLPSPPPMYAHIHARMQAGRGWQGSARCG